MVAAVAALNRLELAGEAVRAALEALTAAHPDWVAQRICVPDFARRYGTPMTSWRPPQSEARREKLAIAYARDGYALLEAVYDLSSPGWLRELPAVDVLRRVLLQNYTRTITSDGREVIRRREKEPDGDGLPPGHARIASPYDLDARWGVKREEFWLGYKLHITETCDDASACTCRPAAGNAGAGAQDHGHDPPGGLDAVEPGHPDIHEHDVRACPGHLADRGHPVRGFADDFQVGLSLDEHADPRSHQRLVVGHQDPDRHWLVGSQARTENPPSGRGPACRMPPSS